MSGDVVRCEGLYCDGSAATLMVGATCEQGCKRDKPVCQYCFDYHWKRPNGCICAPCFWERGVQIPVRMLETVRLGGQS